MTNPVSLYVDGTEWRFVIDGVTRAGRDLYISVSLESAADRCTLTVHVRDGLVFGETAREILNGACAWLIDRRDQRHGYLEIAPGAVAPSAVDSARIPAA